MHENKIVYRDVKPENFIYGTEKEDADLKIIDFDTSVKFNSEIKLN